MTITTHQQILALKNNPNTTTRGCGDGLYIVSKKNKTNGGLYFVGRTKKYGDCHLGTFGSGKTKKAHDLTLSEAKKLWLEIKDWSKKESRDPRDHFQKSSEQKSNQETLRDAVDGFLEMKQNNLAPSTFKEYRNKLNNTILGIIPETTTLESLKWDNGGRRIVQDAIEKINSQSPDVAHRCQKLLIQTFNFAIGKGWMGNPNQNPAVRLPGDGSPNPSAGHHPSIEWSEVPALIQDIELNRCNTHIQSVLATKLMLMTFLRAGALCRLEWEWISKDLMSIPGSTPGLKRKKGKSDHIPHLVPITPQIRKLLKKLEQLNGKQKYLFLPMRESRLAYLDQSSPNNFLRNLGYKDKLRAHGWRSVATTAGVDVLGFDYEVIEKCLGHLPKEKVRKAYDKSLRLEERRDFMNQWNSLLVKKGLKV